MQITNNVYVKYKNKILQKGCVKIFSLVSYSYVSDSSFPAATGALASSPTLKSGWWRRPKALLHIPCTKYSMYSVGVVFSTQVMYKLNVLHPCTAAWHSTLMLVQFLTTHASSELADGVWRPVQRRYTKGLDTCSSSETQSGILRQRKARRAVGALWETLQISVT